MDKRVSDAARARELGPVSLGELIHEYVPFAIDTAVAEEWRAALGANRYERGGVTVTARKPTK